MKRYIQSSTYHVVDGHRYQLYSDKNTFYIYDSDDVDREIVSDALNSSTYNDALDELDRYNRKHLRLHTYITDIYRYCTKRNNDGKYVLHSDYIEYTPKYNTNILRSKLQNFMKSNPGCHIKFRQVGGSYIIYQI